MVEVIPVGGIGPWRYALPQGPSQIVPSNIVKQHGLTEMLRGHWHLSDDGQIMWRRAHEVGHEVQIGSIVAVLPSEQPPWPPKYIGNDPRPYPQRGRP